MKSLTKTITTIESTYKICMMCLKPADVKVTGQQKNALIFEAKHDDGKVHTWLKYNTMDLNAKRPGKPVNRIICPKCNKKGIVNQYRLNSRDPLKTAYVIVHEKIAGRWGKGGKSEMQKRSRCFIRDEETMKKIDRKLKRYVPSSEDTK